MADLKLSCQQKWKNNIESRPEHTEDVIWIKKTLGFILVIRDLGNKSCGAPKDLNISFHVNPVGVFIEGKGIVSVW